MEDTPKIYIADLADYNAGELRGFWLEPAGKSPEEMQKEITEFLQSKAKQADMFGAEMEPIHEEHAIHDYDGFPDLGEYAGLEEIEMVAQVLQEFGLEIVEASLSMCSFPKNLHEHLENCFRGTWDSEEDFARELIDDCYDLDKLMGDLRHYFDYESFTRDLFMGDYWSSNLSGGKVAVFESH